MRWQVTTKENPSGEGVLADRMDIVDGALVFTNILGGERITVITYPAGQWLVAYAEEV